MNNLYNSKKRIFARKAAGFADKLRIQANYGRSTQSKEAIIPLWLMKVSIEKADEINDDRQILLLANMDELSFEHFYWIDDASKRLEHLYHDLLQEKRPSDKDLDLLFAMLHAEKSTKPALH